MFKMITISYKYFISIFFVIILVFFLIINIKVFVKSLNDNFSIVKNEKEMKNNFLNLEKQFTEDFLLKDKFKYIYGKNQKLLSKKMIVNFKNIVDNNGYIQFMNDKHNREQFLEELLLLNKFLKDKKIPLIYCQVPDRIINEYTKFDYNIVYDSNEDMDYIINGIKDTDIGLIDIRDYVNKEINYDDIYFKTDIHMKTESEFFVLRKIVEFFENNLNMKFKDKEKVLDLSNYYLQSKDFSGNLVGETGTGYIKPDKFIYYYPQFYTDIVIKNGIKFKVGEFKDTILNFSEKPGNKYYVTDFLQWPNPFYEIYNRNSKNDKTLVVLMDSMGLRTVSYLSLLFKKIIVLDSRYFNERNYILEILKNNKVDIFLVLQNKYLMDNNIFPKYSAKIMSENTPKKIILGNKRYTIKIRVKNTGKIEWKKSDNIRLCIWKDGVDYGNRSDLADNVIVKPNEEYIFEIKDFIVSPSEYNVIEYQMLKEGVAYFGEKLKVIIEIAI